MKEATGELSSAVVVTISVAILIAFFYFTIWPLIANNFHEQTACEKASCNTKQVDDDGYISCQYKDSTIKCKYKG